MKKYILINELEFNKRGVDIKTAKAVRKELERNGVKCRIIDENMNKYDDNQDYYGGE